MGYATSNRGNIAVSEANNDNNNVLMDLIGNKEDTSFFTSGRKPSIWALLLAGYYHAHGQPISFPDYSVAGEFFKTITASGTAGVHGAKVEIIPASAVTLPFDIHWIEITNISNVDEYQIKLYKGASGSETEIWRSVVARSSNFSREGSKAVLVRQIEANARISASLACASNNAYSMRVALDGHEYDQ